MPVYTFYDRIKETSTTTGIGSFTLDGAVEGFRSFADIGDGNETYYVIEHASEDEWEVGIGTYVLSGTMLTRDTVLRNSNGDTSKIIFSAGTKLVFQSAPAAFLNDPILSGSISQFKIGSGAIVSGRIASGQVGFGHLADGSVQSGTIASGQIGNRHLASGSVLSGHIASGQVGINHIASGAVGSGRLAVTGTPDGTKYLRDDFTWQTVAAGGIASGDVQSGMVASGTIQGVLGSTRHIVSGTIGSFDLGSGVVGSGHLAVTGTPDGTKYLRDDFTWQTVAAGGISSGDVQSGMVASGAVQGFFGSTRQIASGTVGVFDLGSGAIIAGSVGSGAIVSGNIASGQVGKNHLAPDSVFSGHIASGQIYSYHILTEAINGSKIASQAVASGHIAFAAVHSGNIASGRVGSVHLASGAVTSGRLGVTGTPDGTKFLRDDFTWQTTAGGLTSGAVQSGHVASGTVQGFFGSTRHIASGTVGSFDLGSGAVVAGSVGSGAIVSGNIASGQVGQFHISSGAVTSGKLGVTGVPTGAKFLRDDFTWQTAGGGLTSGAVQSGHIASGAVQGSLGSTPHIASGTIGFYDIGSGQIAGTQLIPGVISTIHFGGQQLQGYFGSGHILSGSVGLEDLGSASVHGYYGMGHVASGTIGPYDLGNQVLYPNHFTSGSVTSGTLAVGGTPNGTLYLRDDFTWQAVTPIIATGSVQGYLGSGHIVSGTIGGPDIGEQQILTINIASGNVDWSRLANDSVKGALYTSGGHILAGTVGGPDMASGGVEGFYGLGHIASGTVGGSDIASGQIYNYHLSSGAVTSGILAVSGTPNGMKFLRDDFTWQNITGSLTSGAVQSGHVASGTVQGFFGSTRHIASGTLGDFDFASGTVVTPSNAVPLGILKSGQFVSYLQNDVPYLTSGTLIFSGQVTSGAIEGFFGSRRHISSGTVGSFDFGSGAVMAGQIGSGAIVSGNIASGQVGNNHLANVSVRSGHIASGQVGQFHISSGAVTSGRLGVTGVPDGTKFLRDDFTWQTTAGGLTSGAVQSGHVASGAVQGFFGTTRHVASGTIGAFDFGSGAVLSGAIASGQVGFRHLANASVQSGTIASGQVFTLHVASGGLLSGAIGSGQIGNAHLGSGAVLSGAIASGQVGNNHLANASVRSGTIASGQVFTLHVASGGLLSGAIGSGQIGNAHLGSGAVLSGHIGSGQVGQNHIASGAVTSNKVAPGAITSGHLAIDSVVSGNIASGQVGNNHLANASVRSGHVASGQVFTLHVASGGLLSGAIGSGQIGNAHLGSGAVLSGHIGSGQVGQFHISSGAVTSGKLGVTGVPTGSKFLRDDFSWQTATAGAIASGDVQSGHVASGAVQGYLGSTRHIASGTVGIYDFGSGAIAPISQFSAPLFSGTAWTAITEEIISGVRAVSLSESGALRIARADSSVTMPAIGVVVDNVASGRVANVYTAGPFQFTSGMADYSGYLGHNLWVSLSGTLLPYSAVGFYGGCPEQSVGSVTNSGGAVIKVDSQNSPATIMSGMYLSYLGNDLYVSAFSNDAAYVQSGNPVSYLNNDLGYVTSGAWIPISSGDIASGAIFGHYVEGFGGTPNIASGTVNGFDLASGAVQSGHLGVMGTPDGTLYLRDDFTWAPVTPIIGVGSVQGYLGSGHIFSGTIGGPDIGNYQILGVHIASGTITGDNIASGVALKSGDNISWLNNDVPYMVSGTALKSGDNISWLNNDVPYMVSGTALKSGDNISWLNNDVPYVVSGAWIPIVSGQIGSGAVLGHGGGGDFNIASGTVNGFDLASGSIQSGHLGVTGTPDSSKFLRADFTWQVPGGTTVTGTTSNNTQTEIFVDGVASSRMTISSDVTWMFEIKIAARRTDADNESAAYLFQGCIDNNAGTTALVGSLNKVVIAEDTAAWDVDVQADNTNDALIILVTGETAKTIRWTALVTIVEAAG